MPKVRKSIKTRVLEQDPDGKIFLDACVRASDLLAPGSSESSKVKVTDKNGTESFVWVSLATEKEGELEPSNQIWFDVPLTPPVTEYFYHIDGPLKERIAALEAEVKQIEARQRRREDITALVLLILCILIPITGIIKAKNDASLEPSPANTCTLPSCLSDVSDKVCTLPSCKNQRP
jgi:hypothetical protein